MDTTYRCPTHGIIEPVRLRHDTYCPHCRDKRLSERPPKPKGPKVKWIEIRPGILVRENKMTDELWAIQKKSFPDGSQ